MSYVRQNNVDSHPPQYYHDNRGGVILDPMYIDDHSDARRSRNNGPRRPKHMANNRQRTKRSEVGVITKHLLFFENFLVFALGVAATALGTHILILKKKSVNDALDFFLDPSCDMCLVGCVLVIMGFLGAFGSLRENTFCLRLYYYLMVLFLLCELTTCILAFATYYSPEVKEKIFPTDTFMNAIRKYRDDIDMQNLIDTMQKELQCCGLSDSDEGFLDWNNNPYFRCTENMKNNLSPERCSVPHSCCRIKDGSIANNQCGWKVMKAGENDDVVPSAVVGTNIYTLGCLKSLCNWVDKHALVAGGVLLGILIPQLIVTVLTTNLIKMINLQKRRWWR